MQLQHIILGIRRDPGGDDDVSARRAASSWVLARRRGVTDVSPTRWVASLQSLPRLRATLSIATCFVLALSAGFPAARALVASGAASPSAFAFETSKASMRVSQR